MWFLTVVSLIITPEPIKPLNETLWFKPLKLLSLIPKEPNTPVLESRPPPNEIDAVLCSVIIIVTSYLSGSSGQTSILLLTSLNAWVEYSLTKSSLIWFSL